MIHRIAKIVKNISFILLSLQGQFLQRRLIKRLGYKKNTAVKGCTLDLRKEAQEADIEKLNDEVKTILKRCKNHPELILEFIKEHKTEVFFIQNGTKIFKLIKEDEGFYAERTGFKSLILNLITKQEFKFNTKPMFILNKGEIDIYNLIHYFHKWCAYKNGLKGFDEKSQKLLKEFNNNPKNEEKMIGKLSLTDIERLKNAIARDVQSIDFVSKYSRENEGAKNALEKIKNDGSTKI